MSGKTRESLSEDWDAEVDIREVLGALWAKRLSIVFGVILGGVLAAGYSLSLPNIYKSVGLLVAKSGASGLSGVSGQLGGLAGLAGINIGGGEASKAQIALEVLKSRAFFREYLYEDAVIPLMAAYGWDSGSGQLLLDPDIYDAEKKRWVAERPSVQKAYLAFSARLSVMEERETGLVTLGMEHYSPKVARDWLAKVIAGIEDSVRKKDIAEGEKSINFLEQQSEKNSLISLNEDFANLIEDQIKAIVLASASDDYVFQVIEPPVEAEQRSSPNRALTSLLGALLGGMISLLVALVTFFKTKNLNV